MLELYIFLQGLQIVFPTTMQTSHALSAALQIKWKKLVQLVGSICNSLVKSKIIHSQTNKQTTIPKATEIVKC